MKKNMKFFVMMAVAAMTLTVATACGDDDEEAPKKYEAALKVPVNADRAAQYMLTETLSAVTEDGDLKLNAIDVTESNKVLLELKNTKTNKLMYVMDDVAINGDTYTLQGSKIKGKIEVKGNGSRQTRAGGVPLVIDITVTFSNEKTVTYSTGGMTITATKSTPMSSSEALTNLARTWNILGAIIDLKSSDIKAYEEFDSKGGVFDLTDVLKEAENQGMSLTEKEKKDFSKKIKSVSITKSGLFTIDYANDGGEDVASWKWTDTSQTKFTIVLKEGDMGNKFIVSNTNIDVAFNSNRCNLKLATTVTDNNSKKWDVVLTLKLQSAE